LEVYQQVREDPDRFGHGPVAFLHIVPSFDWQSRGSSITERTVFLTSGARAQLVEDHYRYGVRMLFTPAMGKIGRLDPNAVANTVVRYTVLFQYPGIVMGIIVAVMLGKQSQLFTRVTRKRVIPEVLFQEYVYSVVQSGALWQTLDRNRDGYVSVEELGKVVWPLVRGQLKLANPDVDDDTLYRKLLIMLDQTFPKSFVTEEAAEQIRTKKHHESSAMHLHGWHQKTVMALSAENLPITFTDFSKKVANKHEHSCCRQLRHGSQDDSKLVQRYMGCKTTNWQGPDAEQDCEAPADDGCEETAPDAGEETALDAREETTPDAREETTPDASFTLVDADAGGLQAV